MPSSKHSQQSVYRGKHISHQLAVGLMQPACLPANNGASDDSAPTRDHCTCAAADKKRIEEETEVNRAEHKKTQAELAAQRKAEREAAAAKAAEEAAAAAKAAEEAAAAEKAAADAAAAADATAPAGEDAKVAEEQAAEAEQEEVGPHL